MKSVSVTVLLLMLATAAQAAAGDATRISWATATKGGGFQLFGENIAEVINEVDSRLKVEALATRGSRQNLELLEAGEVDVGQVEGNAARIALDGIGRPAANLKVLSVMYPNPGMFVVRGDSRYGNIEELKGQRIAFGTRASGLRILANDVLDGLGLEPDRDFQQIILNKAAEGPKLVIDGEAEALWGAGIGWPGFVAVANGPSGGRFIPPSREQIQRILEKHPHLQKMTVPAGTYEGQDTDIHSVGLWSLILVRPDLDDELVYRLARAIHRGHEALVGRIPQGRYTQAENTVKYVPAERLHPGAAKYYAEVAQSEPHRGDLPHFDGHIHYNRDVWDLIPPDNAIARLRAAGIERAFVSSTPTEGTERLFAQDPERIVPLLRPYRSPADRRTWFEDPELVARLRQQLDTIPYRGIGEFHVFGANASTPVVAGMIDLASEHGLFLLAHADEDAIVRILEQAPGLTVVWAHAGFDVPVARLVELLARYPGLLIELSFRDDIAADGTISDGWRQLFVARPGCCLVGMDTYVASRWAELGELAREAQNWLAQLPPDVADRIAFRNAAELIEVEDKRSTN